MAATVGASSSPTRTEGAVDDGQVGVARLAERVGPGAGQGVAVGAGAEVRAAGHHHRADVPVPVDLLAHLDEVGRHLRREGVAPLGGGQGDEATGPSTESSISLTESEASVRDEGESERGPAEKAIREGHRKRTAAWGRA